MQLLLLSCFFTSAVALRIQLATGGVEATLGRRTAIGLGIAAASAPRYAIAFEPAIPNGALCDPCVTLVKTSAGAEVTLVGTAHISMESAELVRNVIQQVKPNAVMVELDPSRAGKLMQRSKGDGAPVVASDEQLGASSASNAPTYGIGKLAGRLLRGDMQEAGSQAVGVGLSGLYKQMDQMGFQSGAEFVAAVEEADKLGATIVLGDRDARVTISRLRDALGEILSTGMLQTAGAPPQALLQAAGGSSEMTKENVQATIDVIKQREVVRELASYMRSELPPLYRALIGERDEYMANSILKAESVGGAQSIVAVVGLAHVDGIERLLLRGTGSGVGQKGQKPNGCPASARAVA